MEEHRDSLCFLPREVALPGPKILVCQHVAFELLGTLNPLLKSYGFRIKYVNFSRNPAARPSLDGYAGLILLGGPMSVYDTATHPHLETELRLIDDALERGIPILGICLGAQLLAVALGAAVRPNHEKEIGWYDVSLTEAGCDDPLLQHFAPRERIFQWHGDTFEVPESAVKLASATTCENQAFRYGDHCYGLQFHLEVDEALIERWLSVPVHVAELQSLSGRVDPDSIRAETRERIARAKRLSDRTFAEFVARFGPLGRRSPLPHR